MPEIVTALQAKLPGQLEDLESGYRKLLESDTTSLKQILNLFPTIACFLTGKCIALELTMPFTKMNKLGARKSDALYRIFTREIESQKVVKKLVKQLPGYLKHAKDNNISLWQKWNVLVNHSS